MFKKLLGGIVGGLLLFSLVGCGCQKIEPGHVGIQVNNLGSDRGVQSYTMKTGLVFYMPIMSTIFEYPTYMQTASWTHDKNEGSENNEEITFNTKEGLVVSGDVSLGYQLIASKVPNFYVTFRSDDLNGFTHGFLRNIARDAFNEVGAKYSVEDVYGAKKEDFLKEVKAYVNSQVVKFGVQIEQFGFIGALRIPAGVKGALDAKIQATQDAIRAENQVRQAKAEAEKRIAEAVGISKANELITTSITDKLIEWRRLEVTQQAVAKWNGARPMVEGNGSGLLLNINPNK